MAGDLTELRGEGWKRLLAAARRDLERTGGAREGVASYRSLRVRSRRFLL